MEKADLIEVLDEYFEEKKGDFFIPPENHYLDHRDWAKFRKWFNGIKKTFWTGLVLGIVGFLLLVVSLGVVTAIKIKGAVIG